MGYYYPVGHAYCINGVHYDPGGDIEDDQPHSDDNNKDENDNEANAAQKE